ncbi:hypothetical protein PB1_09207 [Bacillus methanolicus PB1]|uniref:Carbamoyl phosphate synthase ATP-binding domain-containing protein n=1 Tax=Bacillus methanolicus PB1 TaxID=997296 RepID=I3E206_BACMT|nr:ATP-grasp domain-containing protein [Bacillus methanolicus]EIJ80527.1 hypothetical protein PB1_09207 [Bacillus methanolicus PB1]
MALRILTEASGSLVSGYLIKAVKGANCIAVASDIDPDCYGRYLADEFIQMPLKSDSELWDKIIAALVEQKVDIVIPSFDEMVLGWSLRKDLLLEKGIQVIVSEPKVIEIFQDKWLTYHFFTKNGIPTPNTSLEQIYPLVKPRNGRGAKGVQIATQPVDMTGMISQEFIKGTEYTIDVFCDKFSNPIYIVPRKRMNIKEGKSTSGIVVYHEDIIHWVKKICERTSFIGPINIQCIETESRDLKFIEVNPRIAGGMALGFAATENWIKLMVDHFVYGKEIKPVQVKYGLKMMRYYNEIFTFE